MELAQEKNLISLYTIKDPILKKNAQEEIIQQGKAIQKYADSLRAQSEKILEKEGIVTTSATKLNDLGGLVAIRNRMEQGIATHQDTRAILFQIRQRAQSYRQSLSQKKHRGRSL